MHPTPAQLFACRRRLGIVLSLAVAGCLTIGFNLPVAGLLVVLAGFGLAGYGLAVAIVPARTWLDRLLATVTFAMACLAVVAEALSLVVLLGNVTAWTVAAVACGVAGGLLRGRRLRHPVWVAGAGGALGRGG